MIKPYRNILLLLAAMIAYTGSVIARADTLRVMAYNVLYYGNGCQGPNGKYHDYLKTIVAYANPDIISLEKMASIPLSKDDKYGTAPYGFADSILAFALNAAYPGRYNYCMWTNAARSSAISMMFYDQRKLGYIGIVCSYCNITDFTTYKLYYKDPDLAITHDTTFLYVVPTHDLSGDDNAEVRGAQIKEEMKAIKEHFSGLVNMIDLGDFNVRSSDEPFYQALTASADTDFRLYDPPFFPDKKLTYPADWDHNPDFSAYMTTSTRESAAVPNSCGTGGGAKGWYDHIFLSGDIVYNRNHIRYIPNSYKTIGNDGQRFRVSINNRNTHVNNAAPDNVIEALYQMSNKYPVMVSLEVNSNNPRINHAREIAAGKVFYKNEATVTTPVKDKLMIHFPEDMMNQEITLSCIDSEGKIKVDKNFKVTSPDMQIKCKISSGDYTLKLICHHNIIIDQKITKE